MVLVNGKPFTDRQVFLLHAAVKGYRYRLMRSVHDEDAGNGLRERNARKVFEIEAIQDEIRAALPKGTVA